ncbi:MAG TPA: BACON domain-containing carbohydrate-binding protein [Verrucomicrobiae bacterium]
MIKILKAKIWVGLCLAAFLAPHADGACTYSLSTTSRSHGNGATNNSVTVNAGIGCAWTVANVPSWLTIQSGTNGTGTNSVNYTVAANLSSIARTGVVTIAGLAFTVEQDGAPCNYDIAPTLRGNHGAGALALSNPIDVEAALDCAWTVINTNPWIVNISPMSGVSTGKVTYGLLANRTPVRRTGNVLIAQQTLTVIQAAGSCQYEMFYHGGTGEETNHSHSYTGGPGGVNVDTIPGNNGCEWHVENTNSWITITNNASGTNGATFGYLVGPNPNSWLRSGSLTLWGGEAIFTVLQSAAPCSNGFSILPSSATPEPEPETNTVEVTAIGGCPWTVVNTNGWISILSPINNTNSGSVTWAVAYNTSSIGRTGVVVIAGKNFTVRQDPAICTYRLTPTSRKHGYGAVTDTVSIDTLSICSWNVLNTNSWITFYAPTNGVGDSTNVTYSLLANTAFSNRTGLVFIGGQSLVLTQSGVACAIDLSVMHRDHGNGWATNSIDVNIATNCNWFATTTNTWIQITTNSSGTGSKTFGYIVSPNPNSFPRTGYIQVEERTVSLDQAATPCKIPLTPAGATHTPLQETGTVVVASPGGCTWTATTINPWVTILSGATGSGIGVVTYRVGANANSGARSGGITVTGSTDTNYFFLDQDGVTCAYRLSPTNRSHGPGAVPLATFKVLVSNACPWAVQNTNLWINILTNSSGSGSNQVTYSVEANSLTPFERIGALVVQGQSLVITQRGITCAYSVSPKTVTHGYGATANSFNVTTTNGCGWTVINTNPWVIITSNATGSATGPVGYRVLENPNPVNRIGALLIEGQTYTVTQLMATCAISLSATNRSHGHGATSNSVDVDTAAGCPWPVTTTNTWIQILSPNPGPGTGTGTVIYALQSNTNFSPRVGSIQIGTRTLVLNQTAGDCNYKLSSTNRSHGFGSSTNSVNVTNVSPGCSWIATTSTEWITLLPNTTGIGNGTLYYTITLNSGLTARVGTITVADEVLTLTQGTADGFAFEAVLPGPTGEIILKLNGGPPGIWTLQSSANLVTWTNFATITNITGRVQYTVPSAAGTNRFYRAMLP